MEFEEIGDFYIEEQSIEDGNDGTTKFFAVGEITEKNGERTTKENSDAGFPTREEALQWIEKQKR